MRKKELQSALLNDSRRSNDMQRQGPLDTSFNAFDHPFVNKSIHSSSDHQKAPMDNRHRAILFMNIQSICGCLAALIFKKIGREGVSILEFTLARNLFNFCMIQICLYYWKLNPIKDFPSK